MGASEFMVSGKGASARKVFARLQEDARYEEGHGGYTGTIAEKNAYKMIYAPPDVVGREAIVAYAEKLLDDDDPRIHDKWGPAGCIEIAADEWLFFGWASS